MGFSKRVKEAKIFTKIYLSAHESYYIIKKRVGEMSESNIRDNLLLIKKQIAPWKPNIIAVTKYYDKTAIEQAYACGLRDFAESRANDGISKIESLCKELREKSTFHFIGHVQSNKAKKVIKYFDYIQSVDSLKIAELISSYALEIGKIQKVLLELNAASEETKFGYSKEGMLRDFERIISLEGIEVCGLMNMAPLMASERELEDLFEDVNSFRHQLENKFGYNLRELSMGMSNDYHIAVKHGATMIRIGRKLFS